MSRWTGISRLSIFRNKSQEKGNATQRNENTSENAESKTERIGLESEDASTHNDAVQTSSKKSPPAPQIPESQTVVILNAPKQPYEILSGYAIPSLNHDSEVLVRSRVIGLNPIDWKAPDFNFAIPVLPYLSGRESSGDIVRLGSKTGRLSEGDNVMVISTDYRDLRKATYQEYVVASDYNVVKIPQSISHEEAATIGVAFVAAVLALGVCMGVDFSSVLDGPDLFNLVRKIEAKNLPDDVRKECLEGVRAHDRAEAGDWVVIWGASATSANLAIQLARLAGLRVIAVVDKAKHGLRLSNHKILKPDLLVDSHDPQRAIDIIRANTDGRIRFGLDTRGATSATSLLQTLSPGGKQNDLARRSSEISLPSPPGTPLDPAYPFAHLVGLTGLPKQTPPTGVLFHTVPIKLFHELPEIGYSLVMWLERLLEKGLLSPPEIIDIEEGFQNVNNGLDRMRRGEISGGKLVVRLE